MHKQVEHAVNKHKTTIITCCSDVYLVFLCDVGGVDGVHADRNTWRDRCAGQEVRILVVSIHYVDS